MGADFASPAAPLVSVVLATNRGGPFLAEAVRSVAVQTYSPVELIVVIDGAPDPQSIVESVSGMPHAIFVQQPSAGVSSARNTGADRASGEFIVFLDDDDRWHPRRIELQVAGFIDTPEAGVSYCSMQSIDESGEVIAAADQRPVKDGRDVARRESGIILPNLMLRRSAWVASGGFNPDIQLAEDLDLVLTLAGTETFMFVPEVLVDYRAHENNSTRRYRQLARSIDAVVHKHIADAIQHDDPELVRAHRESLRANSRFAWWSALRSVRRNVQAKHGVAALSDLIWVAAFAPLAPADAAMRRVRRPGRRMPASRS